jgi:hypothetical protein
MAMRTTPLGFVSLVVCLAMAGRVSAQTGTATKTNPPSSSHAADNDIVVRLAKVRSIEDVDRVLTQLVAPKPANGNTVCNFEWLLNLAIEHGSWPQRLVASLYLAFKDSADPPGQANVESLLAGWGKHGSWYDLAVMRYVWKFWPRVFREDEKQVDPLRLIPILRQRIEEQPKLSGQLFWYAQWEHRGMKFKEICDVSRSPLLVDNSCGGAEFPAILFVAGAMGQPWLLEAGARPGTGKATAEQLGDWWIMTGYLYFRSIRPFVRYDSGRHIYVYDEVADRENRYLKPDEQEPVCPSTPLPDWDSKIVPEPPAREK